MRAFGEALMVFWATVDQATVVERYLRLYVVKAVCLVGVKGGQCLFAVGLWAWYCQHRAAVCAAFRLRGRLATRVGIRDEVSVGVSVLLKDEMTRCRVAGRREAGFSPFTLPAEASHQHRRCIRLSSTPPPSHLTIVSWPKHSLSVCKAT